VPERPSRYRSAVGCDEVGAPRRVLRAAIPSLLTAVRLLVLPLVIVFTLRDATAAALSLYAVILLSDLADGRVARRFDTATRYGAYFDVLADMVVLLSLLGLFSVCGLLPIWLPAAPAIVAAAFLLSSRCSTPRYDPIGKHYGTVLYLLVGALLWGVGPSIRLGICAAIVAMSVLVLSSRAIGALRMSRN